VSLKNYGAPFVLQQQQSLLQLRYIRYNDSDDRLTCKQTLTAAYTADNRNTRLTKTVKFAQKNLKDWKALKVFR